MKEVLGAVHACGGCGKIGRERLAGGNPSTAWACSPPCAASIIRKGGWGTLAWIKLP